MASSATEEEFGEKGHMEGRDSVAAAVELEENGMEVRAPSRPTCCICMEPWTCNGVHRICCIPCGHVYGRSCLERWLHHCNGSSAKCPQCGEPFALKHIINLYGPGNLWDGCCPTQEPQATRGSAFAKVVAKLEELEKRIAEFESTFADRMSR